MFKTAYSESWNKTIAYSDFWILDVFLHLPARCASAPIKRGFDEHMGYMQGCESHYTHVSACCGAGSPTHDQDYVCSTGMGSGKDQRGYDWFKSGPAPGNNGVSSPDLSANHSNSATLIRDAAVEFLTRMKSSPDPFFLYLPSVWLFCVCFAAGGRVAPKHTVCC